MISVKIKTKDKSYEAVMALPQKKHRLPMKQSMLFRTLLRVVSAPDLIAQFSTAVILITTVWSGAEYFWKNRDVFRHVD